MEWSKAGRWLLLWVSKRVTGLPTLSAFEQRRRRFRESNCQGRNAARQGNPDPIHESS